MDQYIVCYHDGDYFKALCIVNRNELLKEKINDKLFKIIMGNNKNILDDNILYFVVADEDNDSFYLSDAKNKFYSIMAYKLYHQLDPKRGKID